MIDLTEDDPKKTVNEPVALTPKTPKTPKTPTTDSGQKMGKKNGRTASRKASANGTPGNKAAEKRKPGKVGTETKLKETQETVHKREVDQVDEKDRESRDTPHKLNAENGENVCLRDLNCLALEPNPTNLNLNHKPSQNPADLRPSPDLLPPNFQPRLPSKTSPQKSTLPRHAPLLPESVPLHYYKRSNYQGDLDLSPIKRPRKSVAFSDNLASDASDHWGSDAPTPQKSILKSPHVLLHQFSTARCLPRSRDFWHAGTIVVLDARLPDLAELVAGCAEVLGDADFDRKFEVYATLNQICKSNDAATLAEVFVNGSSAAVSAASTSSSISGFSPSFSGAKTNHNLNHQKTPSVGARLVHFARRDIGAIEAHLFRPDRNDPFQARILGQALKVAAFWLAVPAINNSLPHTDVEWFYAHACNMLAHPAISKSLVLPYLCLIKECHYSAHKRPALFAADLPRRMLDALLAIRSFPSSSLVNEKLACLKSLVQNFPSSMADSFSHWFPGLVLCLCDTHFHLHAKTVATGITSLLEAARTYLDAPKVGRMARDFLDLPLPLSPSSFVDSLVTSALAQSAAVEFVCLSLKDMIDAGQYKFAMDIWVGLLLLTSHTDLPLEKWTHTPAWLLVHRYCFNVASILAKATALSSWKAVIYKICCVDLQDASVWLRSSAQQSGTGHDVLKPKLRLLVHLFVNMSSSGYRLEVVDALHQAFMAILYNLLGTQSLVLVKHLSVYWDRIFLPVFTNFYFHKELATPNMHHMGYTVLHRLLKPANQSNEKTFSRTRCLSNDHISISEINSLPPRWVHLQFEIILPLLATVFKLDSVNLEEKLTCINAFLTSIKYVTKKEVLPSNSTLDLIDNLPYVLQPLFDTTNPSYDEIFKLIITLNDTFSAPNLVTDSCDSTGSYLVILAYCSETFTSHQLNAILSMIHGAVGERKSLPFLSNLCRVCKKWKCKTEIYNFIGDCLGNKKYSRFSHQDMILLSYMFESINTNFASVAKKLIQQIVLFKVDEFEKTVSELKLVNWNIQIFKFFVTLMHDAPFAHLKRTSVELIRLRLQNPDDFTDLFLLLTESKFDYEIHCLRTEISHNVSTCSSDVNKLLWQEYLRLFDGSMADLDDLLTASLQLGLEVHDLAKHKWDSLPNLKKFWLEKFKDEVWEIEDKIDLQSEQLSSRQGELESMIASDITQHPIAELVVQEGDTSNVGFNQHSSSERDQEERDQADSSITSMESDVFVRESPPIVLQINDPVLGEEKRHLVKPAVQKRRASQNLDTRRRSKRIQTRQVGENGELSSNSSVIFKPTAEANGNKPLDGDNLSVKTEQVKQSGQASMASSEMETTTKQVSDSDDSLRIKVNSTNQDGKDIEIVSKDIEIVSSVDLHDTKSAEKNSTHSSLKESGIYESSAVNISDYSADFSAETLFDRRLSVVEELPQNLSTAYVGIEKIRDCMDLITPAEIKNLTEKQKYDLETDMMQFILRMRQVSQIPGSS